MCALYEPLHISVINELQDVDMESEMVSELMHEPLTIRLPANRAKRRADTDARDVDGGYGSTSGSVSSPLHPLASPITPPRSSGSSPTSENNYSTSPSPNRRISSSPRSVRRGRSSGASQPPRLREIYQSVSCMSGYAGYSFEEIRVGNYIASYMAKNQPPQPVAEGARSCSILEPIFRPSVLDVQHDKDPDATMSMSDSQPAFTFTFSV
ncbi:uncharacterized protein FIBRA_06089 [Fibroporia radiculosa]|uniref:Uncharacterized protein n=1 Tax=Fibroporia radiculosa TaxID=599839 RepID=J4HYK5_9APHY|nr:uncharacterized protein FIBRA_06089 [Fibroporia radiculosa]CCM03937.1 predicted protein [Fibroporia radiculosa]